MSEDLSIEALRISEQRHRLLAEHANDVVWTMSVEGEITSVSPAVMEVRGLTPEEAMSQSLDQIHPPESMAVSLGYFERLYARLAEGLPPEEFHGELEYFRKDGSTVWTEVQVIPHLDDDGNLIEILGVTRDIDERKRHEEERRQYESDLQQARDETVAANEALRAANEQLLRLATTDPLTGAKNRRYLEDCARTEIERSNDNGQPLAMLMLDIDHFKEVNDRFGHQVGDQVLVDIVQRLRAALPTEDVLARWGGEEFIALLPNRTIREAEKSAESCRHALGSAPFAETGCVTTSVGVAAYTRGEPFDEWIRRADRALYEAKANGRNQVVAVVDG